MNVHYQRSILLPLGSCSKALGTLLLLAAASTASIRLHAQSQAPDWQQQIQSNGNYVPMAATQTPADTDAQDQAGSESAQPLASMNESASSINFEDREAGHLNVGADFRGAWTDNFFDQPSNGVSGTYLELGTPAGVRFQTPQTKFSADFRSDTIFYTGYSGLSFTSYTAAAELEHQSNEKTSFDWAAAAGRLTTMEEYLPSFIGIGSTGVAQSELSSDRAQGSYINSNWATTLGVKHSLTERDSISAALTAGWMENEPQSGGAAFGLRDQLGGANLLWSRAINPQNSVGVQLTDVYVKGLSPVGHANFTSIEGTYSFQFNPHAAVNAQVGPLYAEAGGAGAQGETGLNYAASFGMSYAARASKIGGGFSRVYELGYLTSAELAYQLYVTFDQRISATRDLTVGVRDTIVTSNNTSLEESNFGFSARFDQRILSRIDLFATAARLQQSSPVVAGSYPSFNRDDFTAGIALVLTRPAASLGAQ